jgi:predicted SAM-dependent methyltransferase
MIKLDLGCGSHRIPGYVPIDDSLGHDVRSLPFRDDSVDEIRASHVLEHIAFREAQSVLEHWFRVLKPGGTLKIAVPDFEKIVQWYGENRGGELPLEMYLMGGQTTPLDGHKAIYQQQKLVGLLEAVGFVACEPWKSTDDDCSSLPVSLNIKARKPDTQVPVESPSYRDVALCFTTPRLGFTENMFCATTAGVKLQMSVHRTQGVFWTQGIDRVLTDAIARPDIKWIVTVDYDTVFVWQDIVRLRTIAEANACEILVPMQAGRERSCPLFTMQDEKGRVRTAIPAEDMDRDCVEIATGHFGLTIISADALRKLAKPWFKGEPAPDGGWGEGRMDDDIHFWKRWAESGRKAWLCPRVRVGHMELLVSWPGPDLMVRHQKVNEYHAIGKPWFARS